MGENNEVRSMLEAATEIQADGILIGVKITKEAVDPDAVTMLEDLVTAAFRDALRKCGNVQAQALASAETSTLLPVTKE